MTITLNHPELKNRLSNHEPMVVSALRELGATKAHIARYQAMMSEKTKPITEPKTHIHNDTELQSWFGKRENYAGILEYFQRRQTEVGSRGLVNAYIAQLADGITGAAFHPLIRLGHAVHDFNDAEVVAALAYWVWAYQALPYPAQSQQVSSSPAQTIKHLLDEASWPTEEIDRPNITLEFEAVVALPQYQELQFKLGAEHLTFDALNHLAISALWMHDDFTLLHGVTGMQAVGRIRKWLDQPDVLLEPMWKGLVIAWLSKAYRWVPVETSTFEPGLSIAQLKTVAAHGTRDHTVKLVAACLDQFQQTNNLTYLHVAEREIRGDAQTNALLA